MKRILTICLLMLMALSVKAQDDDVVVVGYGRMTPEGKEQILYKSNCCPARCTNITVNNKTKKTTAIWDDMEMGYITDKCEVAAPIAKDFETLFPGQITGLPKEFVLLYWMLTEVNDETVLHCYFTMPADEVQNLWLACEETAIVDMETGVQYRARRTAPECFRKHFSVKAPVGTALDFQIYFPKLPSTTKEVAIYGVPMWKLRGGTRIRINAPLQKAMEMYDETPQFKTPNLVKAENNYNKDKHETWSVYNNVHLIKPLKEGTMALWRTPTATYLAVAHEQNWMREYYDLHAETMLIDNNGRRYKLKSFNNFPIGKLFWVEGNSGDFNTFLLEFEPISPSITTLTFIEPELEQFDMWGADPEGEVIPNLSVEELRKNQSLFEPIERVIKQ